MEAPPRPPKKDHMQNRKLSPSSIERIQRRQSLTGDNKVPISTTKSSQFSDLIDVSAPS